MRNTAGGTLTLANAHGTPLDTLGLYGRALIIPVGIRRRSHTVFLAAPDSISHRRGAARSWAVHRSTDPTVWPHAPIEARGNFAHGLAAGQGPFRRWSRGADGVRDRRWHGAVTGATLSGTANGLISNVPDQSARTGPDRVANDLRRAFQTGTVWNNAGVLSIA